MYPFLFLLFAHAFSPTFISSQFDCRSVSCSSVCSFCPSFIRINSDNWYNLNLAPSCKWKEKKNILCFQHYSSHHLACKGMCQPCSALQWWVCAQRGWWQHLVMILIANQLRPENAIIRPCDENKLSVTEQAPWGCSIIQKLLLGFALFLIVYLPFDRLML